MARCWALTRELDLAGIDFVTLPRPCEAGDLRRMADDAGVPVVCHTFLAHSLGGATPEEQREGRDAALRGLEAAVALGAPVTMVPAPNRSDLSREASRANWIAGLREIAPPLRGRRGHADNRELPRREQRLCNS